VTLEVLLTALVGNIPAVIILFWCLREREERMAAQDRHERFLLAVAGYRTEPDTQNILRIQPDTSLTDAKLPT